MRTVEPFAVVDGAVAGAQESVPGPQSRVEGAVESIQRLRVRVDAVPVRLEVGQSALVSVQSINQYYSAELERTALPDQSPTYLSPLT